MIRLKAIVPLPAETWSTPAVGELEDRKLLVVADTSGNVTALDGHSFTQIWQNQLSGRITSSPIILERNESSCSKVVCIGTHNGELRFLDLSTGIQQNCVHFKEAIRAVPAAYDINGDGSLEVLVASYGPKLTLLDSSGHTLWSKTLPKHIFVGGTKRGIVSSPLICDVDRDGRLEIVIGIRSARLFCLDALTGKMKWFKCLRYDPDSSPSFVDDGGTPLIVIGGGEHTAGMGDNALIALDGRCGRVVWKAEVGGGVDSSPTIARVHAGCPLSAFACSLASGACFAIDLRSGQEQWRYQFGPTNSCVHEPDGQCKPSNSLRYFTENAICRSYTSPLLADLDGDGNLEVTVGSNNGRLAILNAASGVPQYEEQTGGMIRGSPILSDIDGDGKLELVIPSSASLRIYETRATHGEWPMFKGSLDHAGSLERPTDELSAKVRKASALLPVRMFWHFFVLDALRWSACKIEGKILHPLGLRIFDYHY